MKAKLLIVRYVEMKRQTVSFPEAKSILKSCFHTQWKNRLGANAEEYDIERLSRAQQVVIFMLRIGHC